VRREKAIYHTLNKLSMDTSRKVLLAEAWCPLAAKPNVHDALRRAAADSSTQVGVWVCVWVWVWVGGWVGWWVPRCVCVWAAATLASTPRATQRPWFVATA
jgi:hypothetical protein